MVHLPDRLKPSFTRTKSSLSPDVSAPGTPELVLRVSILRVGSKCHGTDVGSKSGGKGQDGRLRSLSHHCKISMYRANKKLNAFKYCTKVVNKDLNPVWNEEASIGLRNGTSASYRLEAICWDHDKFTRKDYLGEFNINLKHYFRRQSPTKSAAKSTWFKLTSFRTGRKSSVVSGAVELKLWLEDSARPEASETDLLNAFNKLTYELDHREGADLANAAPERPVGMQMAEEDDELLQAQDANPEEEHSDGDTTVEGDSDLELSELDSNTTRKKRRRLRKGRQRKPFHFKTSSSKDVIGVVFLEIDSAQDLPRERNMTKTGFDMDPFVITSFSKKSFRTRVVRHSLNPVFRDKLLLQVHRHEDQFSLKFTIVDRDKLSGNDLVGDCEMQIQELIESGPQADDDGLYSLKKPEPVERKKFKLLRSSTSSTTCSKEEIEIAEDMKSYSLPLNLARKDFWGDKHKPVLQFKAKFVPYPALRQQFWRVILRHYDADETGDISRVELTTMLDSLGATLKESTIDAFFERFSRIDEDANTIECLTIDQCVICLEDQLSKSKVHEGGALKNEEEEEYLITLTRCPLCEKSNMDRKSAVDIVTHLATCASQDWRKVDHLVMGDFVTSSQAQRKWYTKVISKVSYGGYKLGANSANILVQDRRTGQIQEERMSVYVRLGIRLLYKGLKSSRMESARIKRMLKSLSVKQGIKYDAPSSAKDIPSFIAFHRLDMNEVLDPIDSFKSFNQFFYRKLRPGMRPCTEPNDSRVAVSPADCRSVVFNTLTDATEIWVKGQNFSIKRLIGETYPNDVLLFENGSFGIFRLAPQDYHRFHVPVDGSICQPKTVGQDYYTVNPMAIRSGLDVYGENVRVVIPVDTKEFGRCMIICVGAMLVGSTVITSPVGPVKRAEELGYFKFGGSTILLLFQPGKFVFDEDLVANSKLGIETLLRVGSSIGHPPGMKDAKNEIQKGPISEAERQEASRRISGAFADDSLVQQTIKLAL